MSEQPVPVPWVPRSDETAADLGSLVELGVAEPPPEASPEPPPPPSTSPFLEPAVEPPVE